jgi:DNA ligase-1
VKAFVDLFQALDRTTRTNEKIDALCKYLQNASDEDKLWTIALFTDRQPKRAVKSTELRAWAADAASIPLWLLEESWHTVGDLSETIASILPNYISEKEQPLTYWIQYIRNMYGLKEEEKKSQLLQAWKSFSKEERFVFNKLTSGNFRVGVSQKILVKALAKYSDIAENTITHRLMGNWQPDDVSYGELITVGNETDDFSKPYPFYLAYSLEKQLPELGDINEWQAEYKWDGIRCQLIKRNGQLFIWSRGEELITSGFPEFEDLIGKLPDGTVLDGELLACNKGIPMPFQELQKRISRKKVTTKIKEQIPVSIFAYDLLEFDKIDIRANPLRERRFLLEELVRKIDTPLLQLSAKIEVNQWEDLKDIQQAARNKMAEGLMLKQIHSPYLSGRKKGDWWKWKVDPYTVDAVLLYAQSGSGRRANLYTDYTFAVWNDSGQLVPFAKAYSGLTDSEILQVDTWIRKNTIEKFGPVRSVNPTLVFEIGFEGINASPRHKSGIAVRFPRILRWRKDKPASEADHINILKGLM